MSKRKPLAKSDLPDKQKSILMELSSKYPTEIEEIFKRFDSRRSRFSLKAFDFLPHTNEYIVKDLFDSVVLLGETIRKPKENKADFKALISLAELFNKVGVDVTKDEILSNLSKIHTTKAVNGRIIVIIPDFVYGYITNSRPNDLIIKTEYQFGWVVKDRLDEGLKIKEKEKRDKAKAKEKEKKDALKAKEKEKKDALKAKEKEKKIKE